MDNDDEILYNQPIVLDNGGSLLKSGFSGGSKPSSFEYNLVGKPKYNKVMANGLDEDTYVGNRAQKLRGLLRLRRTIDRGEIVNWDDMELLWSHIFYDNLQINNNSSEIGEHPLLITEAPLNSNQNRDKMCELLFEQFNFDALYIGNPGILSLYASGKTTGCVIDCGDGYCSSIPVYEGFSLPSTIKRIDIGGKDITELLQLYIKKTTGMSLFSNSEFEIVRTIKEKVGYIALDYDAEEEHNNEGDHRKLDTKFKLPDGQILLIGDGKYRTSEILFKPSIINSEYDSLPMIINESLNKVDIDLRSSLMSNIVLNGGTTMFSGFGERLLKELKIAFPRGSKIKIMAPPERRYTSWIGGSILANFSAFRSIWINKSTYQEDPKSVHTMFM